MSYYGTKISYGEFIDKVKKTAAAFYSSGIRTGDIVTIMSMHTPETIYAMYALNYIGAVANMLYLTLSEDGIVENIKKTNSKMLLVLNVALSRIESIRNNISCPIVVLNPADSMSLPVKIACFLKSKPQKSQFVSFKDFLRNGKGAVPQNHDGKKTAIIVYTSGSTGEPKGVALSSYNINAVAFQYGYVGVSIERGHTNLVFVPPFFSLGICYLHMPLCSGMNLIICVNPEPGNVVKAFIKHRPNHFVAAPSNALMLLDKNIKDLSFIKSIGVGGEAVSVETERDINKWLVDNNAAVLLNIGYGMTEFAATVTTNSTKAHKENTLGIPLAKTLVKVIDPDTKEELKYYQVGELCFHTPSQMSGYIGMEEENRRVIEEFADGLLWIHTGDLGFVDEDGFVHYSGRIKRIFMTKVGGRSNAVIMKLFPQQIEECLERMDIVKKCAVAVAKDEEKLHVPIVFISLNEPSASPQEVLQSVHSMIRSSLPEQCWAETILIVDDIPMTLNGKIDYRKLEQMAQAE